MRSIYKSPEGERLVKELYRAFLQRWPVPNQQIRIPTSQGETFVVASGAEDAPPLLLLHGGAANSAMWMGDIPSYAARFRVYAVDLIGEPGFSAPSRPPLASDAHAVWLDEVLDALSVQRISITGISLGGWFALDYAVRRPERVARLAVECPGGVGRQKVGIVFLTLALRPWGAWGGQTRARQGPARSASSEWPAGSFRSLAAERDPRKRQHESIRSGDPLLSPGRSALQAAAFTPGQG